MGFRNIISIKDFTGDQIFKEALPGCQSFVKGIRKRAIRKSDPRKKVVLIFFEPSTRTRSSYWEAARYLGWEREVIMGEEATSLSKKESIANTVRMYGQYNTDVIVMRTKIEGAQRFAAEILEREGYNISVQNAGDGTNEHPTQTYLDLLTILEKLGRLDNFMIGFFGDLKLGRTVHSKLRALSHRKNIKVALVSVPEVALQDQYKKLFKDIIESDSMEALAECNIIYGSRLQEERFTGDPIALQRAREKFMITPELLSKLKKSVIIMHPLPYVQEFPPGIRSDSRIIVDQQAWYGMPTRAYWLEQGYMNKGNKTLLGGGNSANIKLIKNEPLTQYLKERRKKKRHSYFLPVDEGVVIDHVTRGIGIKIRSFLSNHRGVRHLIEDVPSKKHGLKDVIVVERCTLSEEVITNIASLCPTVTFNVMKNGLFHKLKVESPRYVTGVGKCPNINCITNIDPEASTKFIRHDGGVDCHYCEKSFEIGEIV